MNPGCPLSKAVAALALWSALAGGASAAVGPPGSSDQAGSLSDIAYGQTGNVFQFQPLLFVSGLGAASDPLSVVALNPALQFAWSHAGSGSGQMQIRYQIDNISNSESFNDLRFMVFLNPDGEQTNFLDRISETWGAGGAQEPSRRETMPFTNDPFDSITARFRTGGNLQDGAPPAACTALAGCDATLGLQWNAATLGPKQSMFVTVSLSDLGQSLSARSLQATAADAAGTVLTVSGIVQVVPEAPAWAMTLAGLGMLSAWLGRRSKRPLR
jgi:hypothetical protein